MPSAGGAAAAAAAAAARGADERAALLAGGPPARGASLAAPSRAASLAAPADGAPLGGAAGAAAAALWRRPLARAAVINAGLTLTWYFLGTFLSLWNKLLLGREHGLFGQGAFPAPFFMTGVQFAAQHLLARALLAARPPRRARPPPLSWRAWARTVAPNGVATGLDIGFSNYSLVFISLSFYVMCKSTTPLFLLGFAIAWGLEKPSWELAAVVGVITTGLLLLVAGETRFHALGFVLVMSAAALAGLRWTITQVLLQGGAGGSSPGGSPRESSAANGHGHGGGGGAHGHGHGGGGGARSAVEVIFQLTPIMSATLLLISLLFERLWAVLPPSPYFLTPLHCAVTAAVMAFGGVIAFSMVWAEYALIGRTSALTFMVVGTFKEIVTVGAAVLVLHEPFTVVNAIGLLVLVAGVAGFNWMKWRRIAAGELRPAPSEDAELELGGGGGGGGGGMKSAFGAAAAGGEAGWPARGAAPPQAAGVELLARGGSAPASPKSSPAVTEATWRHAGAAAAAASPGHEGERPGSASGRPYKDSD